MEYKGHVPINAVSASTAPITSSTIANVPVITFVKYNTAMTTAMSNLTILSEDPTFFFMVC